MLSNECLHVDEQRVEWIVDTTTSYHVISHLELFFYYTVEDFSTIKMRNSSHSKIIGMSDVCVETNMKCKLTLKDVRHVLYLCLNLMSGFALDKQGYESHFSKGKWKLTKGSLVVKKWETYCTLYKTQGKVCNDNLYAIKGTSLELWHKRLGHMSEKRIASFGKEVLNSFGKNESLFLVIIVWLENNIEFHLVANLRRN